MIYPSEDDFYLLLFLSLSVAVEQSLNLDSDTSRYKCYLHWRENSWVLLLAGLLWHCHLAPTRALFEGSSLYFIRSQPPLCKQSTQWQNPCSKPCLCADVVCIPRVQFTALSPLLRAGDAAHVLGGLVVSFSQLSYSHPSYINGRWWESYLWAVG